MRQRWWGCGQEAQCFWQLLQLQGVSLSSGTGSLACFQLRHLSISKEFITFCFAWKEGSVGEWDKEDTGWDNNTKKVWNEEVKQVCILVAFYSEMSSSNFWCWKIFDVANSDLGDDRWCVFCRGFWCSCSQTSPAFQDRQHSVIQRDLSIARRKWSKWRIMFNCKNKLTLINHWITQCSQH